jgi:hypothetical protein
LISAAVALGDSPRTRYGSRAAGEAVKGRTGRTTNLNPSSRMMESSEKQKKPLAEARGWRCQKIE